MNDKQDRSPDPDEKFDGPNDNTVENSEDEMGGGYGGPAPVDPGDEQA